MNQSLNSVFGTVKKTVLNVLVLVVLGAGILSCTESRPVPGRFVNSTSGTVHIPLVRKTIGSRSVLFILDSGANLSLIDEQFYSENPDLFVQYGTEKVMYHGIHGTAESDVSVIVARIDSADVRFQTSDLSGVRGALRKSGYDIIGILGSDWMSRTGAVLDFVSDSIYFRK